MIKPIVSAVSAALAFGLAAPSFAYVPQNTFSRPSNRIAVEVIKSKKDVREPEVRPARRNFRYMERDVRKEMAERGQRSDSTSTKTTHLERTKRNYFMRNETRTKKPGSDRYRTLRPNTRYLRQQNEDQSSALPPMIVRTGGASFDKPTRRDIRGDNGEFFNVETRDRDVFGEMMEN